MVDVTSVADISTIEHSDTPSIKAITFEAVQKMMPQSFQEQLRSKHIIIPDYNLPRVSCDRRGLMSINSLKDVVKIEGMSSS